MAWADAVLEVLSENRGSAVLSTNSAGQVRELQLRLAMRIRLRTPGGKELLGPTLIEQSRDITYNETAALALVCFVSELGKRFGADRIACRRHVGLRRENGTVSRHPVWKNAG